MPCSFSRSFSIPGPLLARFKRPSYFWLRLAFAGAMYAGMLYAALVAVSIPAEFLLNDLACVALLGFAVAVSLRHMRHAADKLLLAVSGLVIADIVIRNVVFVFIVPSYGGHEDFISSQYAFTMQAAASILVLMFALSALAAYDAGYDRRASRCRRARSDDRHAEPARL